MTFRHPQNHPWSFPIDALLVRQLLARDSSAREHVLDKRRRRILIPRGVHLSSNIIPEIEVPRCHSTPYYDHQTGVEAPFFTMGPFACTDTLFPSTPGDVDLYMDMEIYCLKKHWDIGAVSHQRTRSSRSTIFFQGRGSPVRQEARRQRFSASPGVLLVRRPGSREDLDKSEHEREAERKRLCWEIDVERSQSASRDPSRGLKRSGATDAEDPAECPHPKDHRTKEGGLANVGVQTRPIAPSTIFLDSSCSSQSSCMKFRYCRAIGSAQGIRSNESRLGAEVSAPTDAPPSGSGQLVGLSVLTSVLTAAHADKIFQLSHDIQILRGQLALDFTKMSHRKRTFAWGPRQPATRPRSRNVAQVRLGCTSIPLSSIMPSITSNSWYGSSKGARWTYRLCMTVYGK